jgi:hypothetical protein
MPSSAANASVIFIGTTYTPYIVVPFSQRRNYRNISNVCYLDLANSRLYFTVQPASAQAVEFDYIKREADLTTATSPLFPTAHHDILAYAMASKYDPIQLTDKNQSYQSINLSLYNSKLSQMRMENALLQSL